MTVITSTSPVVPSKPTPSGLLWLSESDQIAPWTHAPLVYIYRHNNNNTIPFVMETMRNSLSEALVHYYPLAGRLHWIEGGRLELDCNAMGAQLLEAYSEAKLDELGDFAPTDTVQDLIPKVDYTTPIENWPLFLVQLTRFRCGGLCIGVAISHSVVDGQAVNSFINSWAKLARGENLGDDQIPFHDRTVLRSREPLMPPRFDHVEYTTKPPLLIGNMDSQAEQQKETSVTLLKVTSDQVESLRKIANQNMVMRLTRPYSKYEAIAGHMWRCAYLLSNPLSYASGKLREAIERMTDEYIRSALDFMASQKHIGWLRNNFHIRGYTNAPFLGNPNINIVSWINLPFYDADFGWGKPVYVGPGLLNMDGKSVIMPSPVADGSLIIALRLQTQYMDSFKKFFYADMDCKEPHAMSAKL
uniref:Spermidine hydroxycinnamoyl transferase n=1 Tax=Fagus sylvatica TaxID=28930 RepID=A0A2N9HS69_FAGSY